jgi:hypothetical protein
MWNRKFLCYGLILIINVNRYHSRKNVISNLADISKKIIADRSPRPPAFFELDHSQLPSTICLATEGCVEQLRAIR